MILYTYISDQTFKDIKTLRDSLKATKLSQKCTLLLWYTYDTAGNDDVKKLAESHNMQPHPKWAAGVIYP